MPSNDAKTASYPDPALQLDPGPEPRPQTSRRRCTPCKYCCYTLTTICTLSILFICIRFIQGTWKDALAPHKDMYHDLNNDAPYDPLLVVRPLVEKDQVFDIVATVWMRDVDRARGEKKRGIELVEKAIYSDTVFRGVKMSDKNLRTAVNLEVPTAAFKDKLLSNYDLRGSFVLIPHLPSLLDKVLNYSTWIPAEAKKPPARAYPEGHKSSLAEEVVDAYGTFTPLLSFHNIQSRCPESTQDSETEEEDFDFHAMMFPDRPRKTRNELTTKGKPVSESHPYIITRTHLNIIDMTRLYDYGAYTLAHHVLSTSECGEKSLFGLRSVGSPPDWRLCSRSFKDNGNHEVKIEYSPEGMQSASASPSLAYAPYLFVDQYAWGPLDLVPVPVNREKCPESELVSELEEKEAVNITWNIVFGSISPRKAAFAEGAGTTIHREFNMTDSPAVLKSVHSQVQFLQFFFGHKHNHEHHPFFISSLLLAACIALTMLEKTLQLLYWYKRTSTSTVGISRIGAASVASSGLLDNFRGLFITDHGFFSMEYVGEMTYESLFQIMSLVMLKAVTKAEFVWSTKKWLSIPVGIRFSRPTHTERTSQRVEARTSWRVRAMIFAILSAIFGISYMTDFTIIASATPAPAQTITWNKMILLCQSLFVFPLMTLGHILQLVMNYQSKTFAGMYKLAAYTGFLAVLFMLPAAYTHDNTLMIGDDVSVSQLFEGLFYGAMAIQALIYPRPDLSKDDVDD
ncbi:hypothetical protein CPC08DRAFT_819607 [Agrocybe pediades]|nr:hypothetical protein CPC08DRAFT_819607 [Agrocybe pediades]